jgi:RNA polymerase sigma factor for flagellar operon FliA
MYEKLPRHLELEELVSAGMLGLVDAAARFCPERNVQFRSYAQFRVRGAILDSLRSLDWGPRALRRKGRDLKVAIQALQNSLGRNPTDSEVAGSLGIALEELQQLSGELKALEITSLHAVRSEETGDDELQFLPAREDCSPLLQLLQGESQANLLNALERLPERERLVMTLYYFEELTMKQIGVTLGLVESRISQIHRGGLLRLRSLLASLGPVGRAGRGALRAG